MTARRSPLPAFALAASLVATLLDARAAEAQGTCAPGAAGGASAERWPAPLDRPVTVAEGRVALRAALERLAGVTGIRFTYIASLLPDREVCLTYTRAPVGHVLAMLLADVPLTPVVAAADHIVLAPARHSDGEPRGTPAERGAARQLDRVVVTGAMPGGPERGSTAATTVVELPKDAGGGSLPLAEVLNGSVPGAWIWSPAPGSPVTRFAAMRGASSFGVTAPKVYIDGIEAANPLVLAELDPARIARIEVIRGPQGAALYGADALSGVVNVVTRHEDIPTILTELRASAGTSASAFTRDGILAQEHAISIQRGRAALGATASSFGPYIPKAGARQLGLHASLQRVGARVVTSGIARFHAAEFVAPASPLLPATGSSLDGDSTSTHRRHQYTVGASAVFQPTAAWMHQLTAGVDGYRLAGAFGDALPIPSPSDSAMRAARGGADRLSLRASSTLRTGDDAEVGAAITLAAEHSSAREHLADAGWPGTAGSTGLAANARLTLENRIHVTIGTRVERLHGGALGVRTVVLPMLGVASVHEAGEWVVKLRGAFGRGIRAPRTLPRHAGLPARQRIALQPEEQSGIELGVDIQLGSRLMLELTRFDQMVSGLVQPVAIAIIPGSRTSDHPGGRIVYELQNVGAIDNTGWEAQATSTHGGFTLGATFSRTESRVVQLAHGYAGDLRMGDRMLEVPRYTAGVNAGWRRGRWNAAVSLARAGDWVNYDKLALAGRAAADSAGFPLGRELRAYWRPYGGVTRIGARGALALGRAAALTLGAENLLNHQRDEPDNLTVVPGRTVTVGVRTSF